MDAMDLSAEHQKPRFALESITKSSKTIKTNDRGAERIISDAGPMPQQLLIALTNADAINEWSTFRDGPNGLEETLPKIRPFLDKRTLMWHSKQAGFRQILVISCQNSRTATRYEHNIIFNEVATKEAFLAYIKGETQAKLSICDGFTEEAKAAGQIDSDWNGLGGGAGNMESDRALESATEVGNQDQP